MTTAIANPAFVILPGEGQQLNELGHTAIEKVCSADTGGAYYAFEVISPAGIGIPPHVHSREDEVIYIIEGDYEVFLGGKVFRAGPGSVLNFARGTPHGFQNVGSTAGRTMWVVTPGASFEQFFHELAQVPPGPPDLQMIGALFGKYGMDVLPPPGL
ncbi:MAG: cupin domain-containing protein [Anaerolineae bacterium]|nr:cupin domain-containing protein [Anaerolineae bacterium]